MPCDLLIKARHRTGDLPFDRVNTTPPGAVIVVKPFNTKWGAMEDKRVWVSRGNAAELWKGDFYVIGVEDLDLARAQRMQGAEYSEVLGRDGERTLLHKCAWTINLPSLPTTVMRALERNGYARTTFAVVDPALTRQRTGERLA